MFVEGSLYTKTEIGDKLGCKMQGYLPNKDGKVVCVTVVKTVNPDAPAIILPGTGSEQKRWAEVLCQQKYPIPVFIKESEIDSWTFAGDHLVTRRSTDVLDIVEHETKAKRDNISMVLFLDKVFSKNRSMVAKKSLSENLEPGMSKEPVENTELVRVVTSNLATSAASGEELKIDSTMREVDADSEETITIDDLNEPPFPLEYFRSLDSRQLVDMLCEYWRLPTPLVIGKIEERGKRWWLIEVRDINWTRLEFPTDELYYQDRLQGKGLPIADKVLNTVAGDIVYARFEAHGTWEKSRLPTQMLAVARGSIKKLELESVLAASIKRNEDGTVHIDDGLNAAYVTSLLLATKARLAEEESRLRSELDTRRRVWEDAAIEQQNALQTELQEKVNPLQRIIETLEEKHSNLTVTVAGLVEQQKELADKVSGAESIVDSLEERRRELKDDVLKLEDRSDTAEKQWADADAECESARAKLLKHAAKLKAWHLIDPREYGGIAQEAEVEIAHGQRQTFPERLPEGIISLAHYIQKYIYQKRGRIYYSESLLVDFLTLLRTGDFIILSGGPGSGKSQLVKCVAAALGAEAVVIPVMPNWTSRDDLLGFFNPLQNSFVSAKFLDVLVEAREHSDLLYLICLDEMNLARVENYFAYFLSKLEERGSGQDRIVEVLPKTEAEALEHELRAFGILGKDGGEEVGNSAFEQLGPEQQARIRRGWVAWRYTRPFKFPENVRVIGTVNVDETTQTFSPKVLDRAHVLTFPNPLHHTQTNEEASARQSLIDDEVMPQKVSYPDFNCPLIDYPDNSTRETISQLVQWSKEYFEPLGASLSMRSYRQSVYYAELLANIGSPEYSDFYALNQIVLHKVLPKMSFEYTKTKEKQITKLISVLTYAFKDHPLMSDAFCDKELDRLSKLAAQDGMFHGMG